MNQETSKVEGVRKLMLSWTMMPLLVAPLLLASACVPGANPPPDTFPGSGSGGSFGGPQPTFESPITADVTPPPITGGTLLALADGRTAVAADPDRDKVFIVDYKAANVLATIAVNAGDEPGRATQDADGRVHVALRRGGAVLTITPGTWQVAARRAVCTGPRGLAFDVNTNSVLVACADGDLVSMPGAPEGAVTSRRHLDRDLRDVVISGDSIYVSRFRSAEVFVIDSSNLVTRVTPLPRQTFQPTAVTSSDGSMFVTSSNVSMTAAVAWRMAAVPGGDVLLMHQRGADRPVSTMPGGYGGFACGGIVETTISRVHPTDSVPASPALDQVTLAVDMAVSPDGLSVVLAAPGNFRQEGNGFSQLLAYDTQTVSGHGSSKMPDCQPPRSGIPRHHDPSSGSGSGGSTGTGGSSNNIPGSGGSGFFDDSSFDVPFTSPGGEVTALTFDASGLLLAQTREPATVQILNGPGTKVSLSIESRLDTGHAIFHANSGAGLACASCHPEGGDDGRVWTFAENGNNEPRRTQNLRGGVLATAPFHWDGTLPDVQKLMTEVFVGRMSGPTLSAKHLDTLSHWVDGIPLLPALPVADKAAVERGSAVFTSAGCASCHMGALLTDNKTQNVGTGLPVQTPSLRGVAWRAPYMHTGCAKTLSDRFTASCGGGDSHGATSGLDDAKRADLTAYLETL